MVNMPDVSLGDGGAIVSKFKAQDQAIDELGRQSKFPFSAGPAGSFTIKPDPAVVNPATGLPMTDTTVRFDTGVAAMAIQPGNAMYGSKQIMVLRDLAGTSVYTTDEAAGYGLSNPTLAFTLSGYESAGPSLPTTRGTALVVGGGTSFAYNPCWHAAMRLRFTNGATTATAVAWLRISDGNSGATLYESSDQNFSIGTNVFDVEIFERMVLLSAANMVNRLKAEVFLYAPTGTSLTVQGFTTVANGVSKGFYDLLPSLH
jgi:hypothetical protein